MILKLYIFFTYYVVNLQNTNKSKRKVSYKETKRTWIMGSFPPSINVKVEIILKGHSYATTGKVT
jgi:hypothetical protein